MAPGPPLRKKQHPEFPLRGFVRCADCGSPLTASKSRGKTGRTYPYYRCWVKTCGAKVQSSPLAWSAWSKPLLEI